MVRDTEILNTAGTMEANGNAIAVFKRPLQQHSTKPMTGFLRDGYCNVPPMDFGNHGVAGQDTCSVVQSGNVLI